MDDLILKEREERKNKVNQLLKQYPLVITIKANIPGNDKNLDEAFILVNIFKLLIINTFNITYLQFYASLDGPYYLVSIRENNPKEIKTKLVNLEDTHPLGRFIDLDIYDNLGGSYSRNSLRQCYLCSNPAIICARNHSHTVNELINKVKVTVHDHLVNEVRLTIDQSILSELNLHPKFGLITPVSNGAHCDMDYKLMIKAKDAIIPYLIEMFKVSYEKADLNQIYSDIKKIGIDAEHAMLKATNNINAYKGLIFILGLTVSSVAYVIKHHQSYNDIYHNVKIMCKDIFSNINSAEKTFGINAYLNNNFGGARKEAYNGLSSVEKAAEYLNNYDEIDDKALTMTLIYLIGISEDSVLLKRSGSLARYQQFKDMVSSISVYNAYKINEITFICIKNNLSFGGSADLLISTIFIHLIYNKFI